MRDFSPRTAVPSTPVWPSESTLSRMTREHSNSSLATALWLIRHRRAYLYIAVRGYAHFWISRIWRAFSPPRGVRLGKNVRLQRNRSTMAEHPGASIVVGDHSVVYEDSRLEAYGSGAIKIGSS